MNVLNGFTVICVAEKINFEHQILQLMMANHFFFNKIQIVTEVFKIKFGHYAANPLASQYWMKYQEANSVNCVPRADK